MTTPLLTPDAVREWVGDFEIGKGRPYADTAVFGGHWEAGRGVASTVLVRGRRTRPYRVHAFLGREWEGTATGHVQHARCTCPVGEAGKCKHVAAMLLAYVEDPARFPETMQPEETLDTRSKEELLTLVARLLSFAPELKPLLAIPMPGFVRETPTPELYRALAVDVIRGVSLHDDWVESEVLDGLWPVLWLGVGYQTRQDQQAAEAVTEGITQALEQSGLDQARLRAALAQAGGFWSDVRERLTLAAKVTSEPPPF